jgi:hypothetical protein
MSIEEYFLLIQYGTVERWLDNQWHQVADGEKIIEEVRYEGMR